MTDHVTSPEQVFAAMVADGDMILDQLDARARELPDKTYLHYGEDGIKLTFAQFKQQTDRIAAGLVAAGLTPGQPVSVLTRNSLLATLVMYGIWRAGGVFAPINFNFRGPLLSYQITDTAPFALITDLSFAPLLREVLPDIALRRLFVHEARPSDHDFVSGTGPDAFAGFDVTPFAQLLASTGPTPDVPRGPQDPANIVYTSGTTGPSKGVVQPFRWMNQYSLTGRQTANADDVLYCDLPLYHVGGAFFLVTRAIWQGNTVGLWDKFSPTQFWQRIDECGATYCVLVDVMVPWLVNAPARDDDRQHTLTKVHMQPLPANHHEVARRFGFDLVTVGFGQTESGLAFVGVIDEFGSDRPVPDPSYEGTPADRWRGLPKADYLARCRALGRNVLDGRQPVPKGYMGCASPLFDVAILDEDDMPCPPGTVGQLALRPRFPGIILHEYFRKLEATAKVLRNCWFHTGDAARATTDGSGIYQFVDRMGGFFRVRGENVSSFEVEALIARHPAVRAAAAVPIPAQVGDEDDIVVFVEAREGVAVTADEIHDHARQTMPKYMVPKHVRIIDALPLTPTNKIEKYKLKRSILDELKLQARS